MSGGRLWRDPDGSFHGFLALGVVGQVPVRLVATTEGYRLEGPAGFEATLIRTGRLVHGVLTVPAQTVRIKVSRNWAGSRDSDADAVVWREESAGLQQPSRDPQQEPRDEG